MNVSVALWVLYALEENSPWNRLHKMSAMVVIVCLTLGFAYADSITGMAEHNSLSGESHIFRVHSLSAYRPDQSLARSQAVPEWQPAVQLG